MHPVRVLYQYLYDPTIPLLGIDPKGTLSHVMSDVCIILMKDAHFINTYNSKKLKIIMRDW